MYLCDTWPDVVPPLATSLPLPSPVTDQTTAVPSAALVLSPALRVRVAMCVYVCVCTHYV